MHLGMFYAQGRGGPADFAKAYEWLHRAARQGNASAQRNLGVMYAVGMGGYPIDLIAAYGLLGEAAEQGDHGASEAFEMLKTRMTPAELAEAKRAFAND